VIYYEYIYAYSCDSQNFKYQANLHERKQKTPQQKGMNLPKRGTQLPLRGMEFPPISTGFEQLKDEK